MGGGHAMRLLIVNDNPVLEAADGKAYSVHSWVRFPQHLASICERVTLWSPHDSIAPNSGLPPGAWPLDSSRLRLAPNKRYSGFFDFFRLAFTEGIALRDAALRLAREHDAVVLRLSSPLLELVSWAARKTGKPLVLMSCGDIETQSDHIIASRGLKRALFRILARCITWHEKFRARRASLIYAYSPELAERFSGAGCPVKPMRTPHISERDIVERKDTCLGGSVKLIRVAWLIPSKGHEYLLRALQLLLDRGRRVSLDIVGDEGYPGCRADLEELAGALRLGGSVRFLGWIPFDEVAAAYRRSDIQVVSSVAEGMPRCVQEGAAEGLPLVSTRVGGCQGLEDGETALLVPSGAPAAIADAVERIIEDGGLRRRMIAGGYRMAREHTVESRGRRLLEDIRQVIGEEPGAKE